MMKASWDPSVPAEYSWEPGALERTYINGFEPGLVMLALRTGAAWVTEIEPGFFQVVVESQHYRCLTMYLQDVSTVSTEDIKGGVLKMQIAGTRQSSPVEARTLLGGDFS
jgi:hypothetical protein